MYPKYIFNALILILILLLFGCGKESVIRHTISLNNNWQTIANDTSIHAYDGFQHLGYSTVDWTRVNVPHNWDDYGGYRRLRHGNRHGFAWYRKTFRVPQVAKDKQYFLWFEGVGSYATVWLNGDSVGFHAGGRTSFTLDVTKSIKLNEENILAVRADHPANIRDLPWVCGGCSPEWGFCEGSQPMGIFRPVHLIATNTVRIEPFGVHVWNDNGVTTEMANVQLTTEVKNYGNDVKSILIRNSLLDQSGEPVASTEKTIILPAGYTDTLAQSLEAIAEPHLWSVEDPYLYTLATEIWTEGKLVDRLHTSYGIRTIQWDIFEENATNRFYLNGKPVFINGTAEYEHLFGQGHAFSETQVASRVDQVKAMGFNAFRDAHQPHNLRYHQEWDKSGLLFWTQMSAHIWFDNPGFRKHFKSLLADWVKERRNSPSVILWGLENESTLPEDFARECTDLIRKLDPTTSSQRLVTTCNGGSGTDWNVIQNWSGTYGGDPDNYANELSEQLLNGEYGAWRSIDLHTEGDFDQNGIYSEDRFNLLMESKIRLGEEAAAESCGQFHWLMNSHDNPGRTQSGEGMRDIDRVGPVNYKGALTIWGEPLDLFYLYRSNYTSAETEPMVYIVSHTWPDRWLEAGLKNGLRIFTNCEEVALFNGVEGNILGRQKRGPVGTHIVFDSIDVQYNLLRAVGYVNGEAVAEDEILLHHLPAAPQLKSGYANPENWSQAANYVYRVNCGGDMYTDTEGNHWQPDVHLTEEAHFGSQSWVDTYEGLPAFYGSQRQTHDPIKGTIEWPLIQSFRYGRHELSYHFPLPDGQYTVELYFVEPWYGTGGGMDCTGWRVFDVAINDKVMIDDLDIWSEIGHDKLLRKVVQVDVTGGALDLSFPEVKSGQAVISAIAISTLNDEVMAALSSEMIISKLNISSNKWSAQSWLDTGVDQYSDADGAFYQLAPLLYGKEWLKTPAIVKADAAMPSFELSTKSEVLLGIDTTMTQLPEWLSGWTPLNKYLASTFAGQTYYQLYKKQFPENTSVQLKRLQEDAFAMYPVIVAPLTTLDDPIDLRKTTTWQVEDGEVSGNAHFLQYLNKDCALVPDTSGALGFTFQVGLASKYGLQFRFINGSGDNLDADVKILAADGREMWRDEWTFPATPNKWKSFRTDTQTTINAGTYTIWISPKGEGPLYFDWVKVQ